MLATNLLGKIQRKPMEKLLVVGAQSCCHKDKEGVKRDVLMRKLYLTKNSTFEPASPCSCTLRKLELDAKAEEASGDRVRIVITIATRDGKKNLGPTALCNGLSMGAFLIELTAMMQEIRQSCGLAARKRTCGSARSTEQRKESGSGTEGWRRRTSVRDLVSPFGVRVVVSSGSQRRHIWML